MLISPEWVLTAHHCIFKATRNKGAVRIGAHTDPFTQGNNGGQDVEFFRLDQVVEHPDYNGNTVDYDFALLRLRGKSNITPVPLDSTGLSETYSTGEIFIIVLLHPYYFYIVVLVFSLHSSYSHNHDT